MREIKFRAWNKKTNVMVDLYKVSPLAVYPEYNYVDGVFIPFHKDLELMQFTGLHDKNGKEIYEGDRVNVRNWGRTNEVLHTGNIVWNEETASWDLDPWFDVDSDDRWRNIEVIGNIYEGQK